MQSADRPRVRASGKPDRRAGCGEYWFRAGKEDKRAASGTFLRREAAREHGPRLFGARGESMSREETPPGKLARVSVQRLIERGKISVGRGSSRKGLQKFKGFGKCVKLSF